MPEKKKKTTPRAAAGKTTAPKAARDPKKTTPSAASGSVRSRASSSKPPRAKAAPAPTAGAAPAPAPAAGAKGRLKIALVSAEMVPLAKVGGLGDVVGALSRVLNESGHRAIVVLPHYKTLNIPAGAKLGEPRSFPVLMRGGPESATITEVTWRGQAATVYLIGGGHYFDREGIYTDPATGKGYADEARRFIFFQKAVLEGLKAIEFRPDVLHLNDYQTGLIPAFVKLWYAEDSYYKTCATVYSIHNMGYQGVYGPETAQEAGIPAGLFYPMSPFEFYGNFNFMKAGVTYAELVTTVSERYAREITESREFGFGLEGALRGLGDRLRGILNGIDPAIWSPQADKLIQHPYGPQNLHLKLKNKEALLDLVKLPRERAKAPLIGIISRLVAQKGFDLIEGAASELMAMDATWVVLGDGEPRFRKLFETLRARHPDRVACEFGFNDALAHQIEAGADIFLMPSRYEPCGLNQMYSLRYGTVPVVRATGGLADTVRNYDVAHRTGTGFSFEEYSPRALASTMARALAVYQDKEAWKALMLSGMSQDFSWAASAKRYLEAYEDALALKRRQSFATWLTASAGV